MLYTLQNVTFIDGTHASGFVDISPAALDWDITTSWFHYTPLTSQGSFASGFERWPNDSIVGFGGDSSTFGMWLVAPAETLYAGSVPAVTIPHAQSAEFSPALGGRLIVSGCLLAPGAQEPCTEITIVPELVTWLALMAALLFTRARRAYTRVAQRRA
jgi:hypothetical protein